MKKFTLTLTMNNAGSFIPNAAEVIESDHILELLALFPRVVAQVLTRESSHLKEELESLKYRLGDNDDDIPF